MIPNPFSKEGKKPKEKIQNNVLSPGPPKSVELSENYDSVMIDEAIVTVDQKMMMHNAMLNKQPQKKFMRFLRLEKFFEKKVDGKVVIKKGQDVADQNQRSEKAETRRKDDTGVESGKKEEGKELNSEKKGEKDSEEAPIVKGILKLEKNLRPADNLKPGEDRKARKEFSMLQGNVSADVLKNMQNFGRQESNSSKRSHGSKSRKSSKGKHKKKILKTRTLENQRAASADQDIRGRAPNAEEASNNSGKSVKSILKRKGSLKSERSESNDKSFKKQVSFSNKKSVVNYNPHKFSISNQSPMRKLKK